MRDKPRLHGTIKLAFDVGADGAITGIKATGLDPKIAGCVAGAVFDLDITPPSVHGAGHATTQITFTPEIVATTDPTQSSPPPPPSGFWCWSDTDVGLCARFEEQCQAALDGYTRTGAAIGEGTKATPCTAQRTAWTNGEYFKPTKKLCGRGCKQVH